MVDSMRVATISRSLGFVEHILVGGFYPSELLPYPTSTLTGALYSGIFSTDLDRTASDVLPSCPTGNCTFPDFQSLAFCGSCKSIELAANFKSCSRTSKYYKEIDDEIFEGTVEFHICQLQFPDGFILNLTHSNNSHYAEELTLVGFAGDALEPVEEDVSAFEFTLVRGDVFGTGKSTPLSINRCALRYCINTYKSSVINGQLTEEILGTWDLSSNPSSPSSSNYTLSTVLPAGITISQQTKFEIGKATHQALNTWLHVNLQFSTTYETNGIVSDYEGWTLAKNDIGRRFDLIELFNRTDPADLFRNLAQTLTTYIRSLRGTQTVPKDYRGPSIPDTGPIQGTAYELQAYISIQWGWLAYPAALLVLTQLFFILVVVQSAVNGTAIWKSSPLALLFHGLSGLSVQQEQACNAMDISKMDEIAKNIEVRLQEARLVVVER
jgi:hypothetical protein